jgi:hypothetical protein
MALLLKDRVKETTTTTGTGDVTLAGAVEGFQTFGAVLSNSDTTYYAISHRDYDEWEVGLGTYDSTAGTIARTTVLESSNSGSAVSFTAGTKDIFITLPAEKAVTLDANDDLSVGNITTSGYLRGPATFTIDPAAYGDNTGTLVVAGNLQVDGTTTTVNSTNVSVDDLNITVASGAANAAAANGAGLTVDGANATFTYDSANDRWAMNKDLATNLTGTVTGTVSSLSNHDTDDLAEGSNLYYTTARFDTAFSGKSTTDLTEGTNLYYTTARANTDIDTRVNKSFVDALNVDADTLDGLNSTDFATAAQGTNADTAFGWGDHSAAGYLTSYTETDPIYTASSWYTTTNNSSNWDAAYAWGDHAAAGYGTTDEALALSIALG